VLGKGNRLVDMLQVDMTGKYMYRQVDMTKKANWYDKVGKLIW
jgi:hypothetical protein